MYLSKDGKDILAILFIMSRISLPYRSREIWRDLLTFGLKKVSVYIIELFRLNN